MDRLLRLKQIVGDPKAEPPTPAIIPVSASTWWAGVRSGRFPQPIKLGPRTTAWKAEDIRHLIEAGPFTTPADDDGSTVPDTAPTVRRRRRRVEGV